VGVKIDQYTIPYHRIESNRYRGWFAIPLFGSATQHTKTARTNKQNCTLHLAFCSNWISFCGCT